MKIPGGQEFQAVLSRGRGQTGKHLRLLAIPNGLPFARFGQAVGRKVCPSAVGRNYMKRVSRELFRRYQKELAGLDVVLIHRRRFSPGAFDTLSIEFEALARSVQKCRDSFKPSSVSTS